MYAFEPSSERKNCEGVKLPVPRFPAELTMLVTFKEPLGAGHPNAPTGNGEPVTVAVTVSRFGAERLSTDCPSGRGRRMFPVRFTPPRAAAVFGPQAGRN